MEQDELQSRWPELKKKLMQKYPHLTADELACEIGKEGEVLKKLQKKLGENWKDIKEVLSLLG